MTDTVVLARPILDPSSLLTSNATRQASTSTPQQTLTWPVPHPQVGSHVIRSRRQLVDLWKAQGGSGEPPQVDFQHCMVLAVFAGEGQRRETLTIHRIKQDEAFTTVYVCAFTRPWSTLNPMHVMQVPRTETPVQFVRLG